MDANRARSVVRQRFGFLRDSIRVRRLFPPTFFTRVRDGEHIARTLGFIIVGGVRTRPPFFDGKYFDMKIKLISLSLLISLASVTGTSNAGCLKGALIGGVGGHVAGHHGLAGAAVGCAIGHHVSKKKAREQAEREAQARRDAQAAQSSQQAQASHAYGARTQATK
jgi:hypothetical protein